MDGDSAFVSIAEVIAGDAGPADPHIGAAFDVAAQAAGQPAYTCFVGEGTIQFFDGDRKPV